jgi:hypothetical protein
MQQAERNSLPSAGSRWWAVVGGVAASLLLGAQAASAVQLTLSGNERLNFFAGSPGTGTSWSTGPGNVDYDAIGSGDPHPGEVFASGTVPSLNYHTTTAPTTNVNFNFTPDLTFTLEAALVAIDVTDITPTQRRVRLEFGTTIDGLPDLVVTDPFDATVVLEANLIAGTFLGNPVPGLRAQGIYNPTLATPQNLTMSLSGFLMATPSSLYLPLFADSSAGAVGFETGQVLNWEIGDGDGFFDFNDIASALVGSGTLISHVAEANGNLFAISSGQFVPVPEPGSALGVLAGLTMLAAARRGAPKR